MKHSLLKVTLTFALPLLVALAITSAAFADNPNYPKQGVATGYFGGTLYPGQSVPLRQITGLGWDACGLSITQAQVQAATPWGQGYLTLWTDGDFHAGAAVPAQQGGPGFAPFITLKTKAAQNELCTEINDLAFVNSGQTELYLGEIRLRYTNGAGQPPKPKQHHVGCASTNGKLVKCYMGAHAINVQLFKQYSNKPCIQGKTWAPSWQDKEIWVTDGCQADFLVTSSK